MDPADLVNKLETLWELDRANLAGWVEGLEKWAEASFEARCRPVPTCDPDYEWKREAALLCDAMPSLISYASRGGVETDYEPETLHFILAAFLLASVASLSPREKDPRLAHMPWRVDCGWIVPGGRWSILGNLDREELSAFRRLGVAAWLALGMESALESIVTATTGKQCDDESEENGMSGITHSKDFSSLTCNGKTYYFASPLRQDIIRLLFQEWATTRIDGAGVLTEDVIGKRLRGSTGTVRVAKALGKVDDVRDIVKRVKPATWGLWLNFPQERDPGW